MKNFSFRPFAKMNNENVSSKQCVVYLIQFSVILFFDYLWLNVLWFFFCFYNRKANGKKNRQTSESEKEIKRCKAILCLSSENLWKYFSISVVRHFFLSFSLRFPFWNSDEWRKRIFQFTFVVLFCFETICIQTIFRHFISYHRDRSTHTKKKISISRAKNVKQKAT